jgi:hypothetical protein
MTNAIRWLRISYWVGAIVDLIAGVQMAWPPLFAYAMGMGASLMFGWTALLLWADRRPVDRMGVLPLTIVPVIGGLALNEAVGVGSGFLSVMAAAPIWALQAAISALFLVSYGVARRALRADSSAT